MKQAFLALSVLAAFSMGAQADTVKITGATTVLNVVINPTKANVEKSTGHSMAIIGSGTGKGLVAQAVHYHSLRRDKPMVSLNCGAMPENEVWVNADVARRLGLESGREVRLVNQDGAVSSPIKVKATERIRTDCVYAVHGFGHTARGLKRAFGKGASDAQLITRYAVDPLMGGTGMNVNFVTLQPVDGVEA